MNTKLFEIRDRGTFIPAMGVLVSGDDGYLMRRAGFGSPMVYLVALATERACYDPYNWGNRTMVTAHNYIAEHWDSLTSGDVVDVEFILGETSEPKTSEQCEDDPEPEPRRKLTRTERQQGLADRGTDTWSEYREER